MNKKPATFKDAIGALIDADIRERNMDEIVHILSGFVLTTAGLMPMQPMMPPPEADGRYPHQALNDYGRRCAVNIIDHFSILRSTWMGDEVLKVEDGIKRATFYATQLKERSQAHREALDEEAVTNERARLTRAAQEVDALVEQLEGLSRLLKHAELNLRPGSLAVDTHGTLPLPDAPTTV